MEEFEARGLVAQISDREALVAHLTAEPRTLYCGFDPTADSLHIGNLLPLLALRRFQLAGHRPIVLVGGATGLIGDPSHRVDERSLNAREVVQSWVEKIARQVKPFVDFEGRQGAQVVNNLDWTQSLDVITFLREIGKHFSVNAMIQRDSVRSRLERDGQGISYTEFSYMLLQGMDFLELSRRYGCSLQIGGSDQWGNIVSGIDLIRRHRSIEAFGMTLPLVTKADGTKFGKTASGAIWLSAEKTSPYAFYQFWLGAADADVMPWLRYFTFLGAESMEELSRGVVERPHLREAQKVLAAEVTQLVHGSDALHKAIRITDALFSGDIHALDASDFAQLAQDGLSTTDVTDGDGAGLLKFMVDTGLARSLGEARKLVESKAVSLNGAIVADSRHVLSKTDLLHGRYFLVRKGKKNWALGNFKNI
ncbi:MAG: tyrosine--tRNA ligase [Pseudomonadales bacterium]